MEKNDVVGYIPKLLFRIYLTLKDKFDPKKPIREDEKICCEISKKLILNPDTILLYSPVSSIRYIKNDQKQIYITIENRVINLINHVYSYSVYVEDEQLFKDLITKFDKMIESRIENLDREIRNNIQHSLNTIFKNLG